MPTLQQEIEFSDLLKRNYQTINSICLRFCCGDAFYFDELRQECALAIWREFSNYGLDRFRGENTETAWIYQISYHTIATYLRNPDHREIRSIRDFFSLDQLNSGESQSSTIMSQALEDWTLFDELMEQLDNRERIMLDHYLSEDTYSTIARTQGITESNARKRMSRFLNKLKKLIPKK